MRKKWFLELPTINLQVLNVLAVLYHDVRYSSNQLNGFAMWLLAIVWLKFDFVLAAFKGIKTVGGTTFLITTRWKSAKQLL